MSYFPRQRRTRERIATQLAAYEAILATGVSQQTAADELALPRTTVEYWRQRKAGLDSDPELVAFFESPVGAAFLHRLVLAAHFTMSFLGACGIRVVCQYLALTGLDQFVAASYGAQQWVASEMETTLGTFGQVERRRLGDQMPPKQIAVCEDETFHPEVCLVGIEPVSNFLLLEQYAANRTADTWTAALQAATAGLPVEVMQVTSDQGSGICAHATQQLGVHQSPDVFHVQQEVLKGTSGALASQVRHREKAVAQARGEVARQRAAKTAYTQGPRGPGRPPDFARRIAQAEQQHTQALQALTASQHLQDQAAQARKAISTTYHPFHPDTGARQDAETVNQALHQQFTTLEQIATDATLSDRCRQHLSKAKRVVTQMVATIAFFWLTVQARIAALDLTPEVEAAVYDHLLPALYLHRVADKAQLADDRQRLRATATTLLTPLLAPDGPFCGLSGEEVTMMEHVATECVEVFQRSSSCVEGRNGHLALRHHALHRLRPTRLAALTVVHNYFVQRPDGTTAAERFFGTAPRDVFEWILDQVELPGRPAQKRKKRCAAKHLLHGD
jgi:hypothetical protein